LRLPDIKRLRYKIGCAGGDVWADKRKDQAITRLILIVTPCGEGRSHLYCQYI